MVRGRHRPSRRPVSRCSGSTEHRARPTQPRKSLLVLLRDRADARRCARKPGRFYDAMHPPRLVSVPFLESNPARVRSLHTQRGAGTGERLLPYVCMCVCVCLCVRCEWLFRGPPRQILRIEARRIIYTGRNGSGLSVRAGFGMGLTLLGVSLCVRWLDGAVPSV